MEDLSELEEAKHEMEKKCTEKCIAWYGIIIDTSI